MSQEAFDYDFLLRLCQDVGIPPDAVPFQPHPSTHKLSTRAIRRYARWAVRDKQVRAAFLELADRIDRLRADPSSIVLGPDQPRYAAPDYSPWSAPAKDSGSTA
jgi:hypothetical protein